MKHLLIFFSLIFSFQSLFALDPENLFLRANDFYKKAQYDSAASVYKRVIDSGNQAPEIFYNLANAFYKTKNYPEAILNYERALKLSPDDADSRFNLALANLFVVDKIIPVPQLFYKRWLKSFGEMFSSGTWGLLAVVFSWLAFFTAILFVLTQSTGARKFLFYIGLVFVFGFFTSMYFSDYQAKKVLSEDEGIVFESSVYVKSSPDEKGIDLFILHEGVKVFILDAVGEWKKVKIANGNEGWIRSETIEII